MENNTLQLDAKIEALLFYKGEPLSFSSLAKQFEASEEEIRNALIVLKEKLAGRGLTLVQNENEVMLGTATELSSFFETLRKEELTKDLSKASLETLSIILYKNNVGRSDIDYIRGVNSSFILRNLQIRGLVDKKPNPKDSRTSIYSPSLELLSFMGVSNNTELPDYELIAQKLKEQLENQNHGNESDRI